MRHKNSIRNHFNKKAERDEVRVRHVVHPALVYTTRVRFLEQMTVDALYRLGKRYGATTKMRKADLVQLVASHPVPSPGNAPI